ncbi:ABC transporter ATP-binding protein [Nonlabens agnitus]|uniref:Antibiotic ABC transporter ATP-binding protein n=1 Tax=Nonlabens agnitus TaxID=870484 RepID=A0A2S9WTK5_9FLAO|nr:ABC transporter ATP-binding protein [Nonlabens agnitus]PRP66798.1 antibiotic ABC transporter ATP-binding protein [Nonlabens agnitus]
MNYFKEILQYARPYRRYGVLNIICNIFYALFGTLTFIALMPVMKVLFQNTERVTDKPTWNGLLDAKDYLENYVNWYTTTVVDQDQEQALIAMIIVIVVLALLKNIFGYLGMYFITFLRNGVLRDIRNDLYEKITHLPIAYFSEKRKGDVIVRSSSDVEKIQTSFLSILELVVKEPLNIIFTLGAMLLISPALTGFVLVFIPLSGFIISKIGKKLKSQSTYVQEEQGYFTSLLEETLSGLKVIKGFNAETRLNETFQKSTHRFYKYSNALQFRKSMAGPASEFLGICVISGLFWFGGKMVFGGDLNGEYFVSYMALAYGILTPAKAIAKASYGVKEGNASAERVLEILHTENHIKDKDNAVEVSAFAKAVQFNNLSFAYEDEEVLKDFSLEIPKGSTVALVGQSGSGKSTIANLVTRFYDVSKGSISIDGHDIKDVSLKSLRNQMALVTQDSILFNDTVAVNVALSNKNATDEEVIEALKIANAWEFVSQLPQGIHTNIGDSGNKLSGGQKQRLSIARAVLKNAPILILDEATSALDTESERLVQEALENVMKNRTSIVIAHRLSTIQKADKIVVMSKGKIVEQGTHEELIALQGIYNNLVNMQSLA